jgi:hypothetical protein
MRVNTAASGVAPTDLSRSMSVAVIDEIAGRTAMVRNAEADDVTAAIVGLLDSPFTTGATLAADGSADLW